MKMNKLSVMAFFAMLVPSVSASERVNLIDSDLSLFNNVYRFGEAEVVNDTVILKSTGNFFLMSKSRYSDFILEAEVKMPDVKEYHNSGIIFRAQLRDVEVGQEAYGYQAEVDPSDRKWSGGLYDQGRREWLNPLHDKRSHPDADFEKNLSPQWTATKSNAYKPLEWNQYRIECRGNEIKIFLNDVLTTHVIDSKDSKGLIGLQHHGSHEYKTTGKSDNIVMFRNVYITELDN